MRDYAGTKRGISEADMDFQLGTLTLQELSRRRDLESIEQKEFLPHYQWRAAGTRCPPLIHLIFDFQFLPASLFSEAAYEPWTGTNLTAQSAYNYVLTMNLPNDLKERIKAKS